MGFLRGKPSKTRGLDTRVLRTNRSVRNIPLRFALCALPRFRPSGRRRFTDNNEGNIMRTICAILLCAVTTAACTTVERVTQTPSGRPEVTVAGSSIENMSAALLRGMQDRGYMLQNQQPNSILFTREMEGGHAILAQLMIGNSYSTTPQMEIRFTLAEQPAGIRVIANISMSTQMALGQIRRHDLRDNNNYFN